MPLLAQPAGISLVEAVQRTLDRHPLLRIQQKEVDIGLGLKQQAAGRFDTLLEWSGNHGRMNDPMTAYERSQAALSGITASNQAANLTGYGVGVQKLLRSGILINPGWNFNRSTDNIFDQSGVNQSHLSVEVVLPLLRSRGREVVTAQERSAELTLDASLYDLAETAAELITNTAVTYWNYVAAMKSLEVQRGSEARGRALLENVQVLIEADRLPRSDRNDVTANLADRTTSRIAAEQQVVQARQALGLAMGLEPEQMLAILPPSDDFPPGMDQTPPSISAASLQSYVDRALARRADYLAARKREQSSQALLRAAQNQVRPQLDLTFSTGYSGLQEGRRPDRLLGSAFTHVGGADAIAGLRYSFPLQNNLARGQLLQASATYQQAGLRYAEIGRGIASNVIVVATSLANSIARLKSAHQTVLAFQSALEGERDKLRLGVGSLVDILTIEDRLTAALNNQVHAELAYATSLIQFRFATGTLIAPGRAVQPVERSVLFSPPFQEP